MSKKQKSTTATDGANAVVKNNPSKVTYPSGAGSFIRTGNDTFKKQARGGLDSQPNPTGEK